ncbi:signal peptide containing protein [Theileria equi strain WA]|uniref:Signal peptide containing protein n=1 Tax=Theileria equi strain WA TaxID=1537102 RepID=L1LB50_THEEQ|nr:signal peptide containing protein [Theileria equi strain WA]EKX72556.1 signal peptide containing protein [Theileria equi strain WA]|eukprot:XP_004832008.1 signal peptide containing protein [Theileria equi strain WA]
MRLITVLWIVCAFRLGSAGLVDTVIDCFGSCIGCVSGSDLNLSLDITKARNTEKVLVYSEIEMKCQHRKFQPIDTVAVTQVRYGNHLLWKAMPGAKCVLVNTYFNELGHTLVRLDSERGDISRSVFVQKTNNDWNEVNEQVFRDQLCAMRGRDREPRRRNEYMDEGSWARDDELHLDDQEDEEDSSGRLGTTASSRPARRTRRIVVDMKIDITADVEEALGESLGARNVRRRGSTSSVDSYVSTRSRRSSSDSIVVNTRRSR